MTDRLEPFYSIHKRFKVAIGGRGGTKSQTCVDILINLVANEGKKVCVFREFGSSIEDSVWSLIEDEIYRIGVPGFKVGQRKIEHEFGGVFKSKGLGRDSKSVKSYSGFDIFLVEEGDFLTDVILRDLTPTLRKTGSEMWLIFNPQSRGDAVSKRFLIPFYKTLLKDKIYVDDLHYIVWTNWDENPWFPAELEAERLMDKEILSKAEYAHKWEGHFNDHIEHQLIKLEWFEACIDAHKKIQFPKFGSKVASHDPSDLGTDDKAYGFREGRIVKQAKLKTCGDVNEGCDWALENAIRDNVHLFVWDGIGEGSGLKKDIREALKPNKIDWRIFKGNEAVKNPSEVFDDPTYKFVKDREKQKTNKEMLKNWRAQDYWLLRNCCFNTYMAVVKGKWCDPRAMISFDSETIDDLELLQSEVCRIPRKPNNQGVIQIMPKQEMKNKYKIASPNLADMCAMLMEEPVIKKKSKPIGSTSFFGSN